MRRFRRTAPEPRLELVPLIDVMMTLLTFSLLAMAVMVRADVLDVKIPALRSGKPAEPGATITVAVSADGALAVNREPVAPEALVERIRELRTAEPRARLFVAADESGRSGDLLALLDRLAAAGLGDFSIVGRPADARPAPAAPPATSPPPPPP